MSGIEVNVIELARAVRAASPPGLIQMWPFPFYRIDKKWVIDQLFSPADMGPGAVLEYPLDFGGAQE